MKEEFLNISNNLNANHKKFHYFNLIAPTDEIPENVFIDIKFYQICIIESNFTRIHSNAFNGTSLYTWDFYDSSSAPKLRNSPPDYDFYEAFSSLVNLFRLVINLDNDTVHQIPDYAFDKSNQQKYLFEIRFIGNSISIIGNYAFYNLPSIQKIYFKVNSIQYISAQAFDFRFPIDILFDILLTNAKLDENCLESGVFGGPVRKIYLYLSIDSNI